MKYVLSDKQLVSFPMDSVHTSGARFSSDSSSVSRRQVEKFLQGARTVFCVRNSPVCSSNRDGVVDGFKIELNPVFGKVGYRSL